MTKVSQMKPGQQFVLLRTMEIYTFIERRIETPSGVKYIVHNQTRNTLTRLHAQCHVKPLT